MGWLFGRKKDKDKDKKFDPSVRAASGYAAGQAEIRSYQAEHQRYEKPAQYDRTLYDSGAAKRQAKLDAFDGQQTFTDPYTGNTLVLTKQQAKARYGSNWQDHLAESDHKVALKQVYDENKDNAFLTNNDIKNAANDPENIQVTSRRVNNAKRDKSNTEFADNEQYRKDKGVKLTEKGKQRMKADEQAAHAKIKSDMRKATVKNVVSTAHNAGMEGAKSGAAMGAAMSVPNNLVAVIKGDKEPGEAVKDIALDTAKAGATSYAMNAGLVTVSQALSNSSSKFIQALIKNNVPAKVVTTVMAFGGTLKRLASGEITMSDAIYEAGGTAANLATYGTSMAVGQMLIPIPVVGGIIGAFVGSMLTNSLYESLAGSLRTLKLEHDERMRMIEECEAARAQLQAYRQELQSYLDAYLKDYEDCFESALTTIDESFARGDANGVIAGANAITRKLGGKVNYNNLEEFDAYFDDDTVDIL